MYMYTHVTYLYSSISEYICALYVQVLLSSPRYVFNHVAYNYEHDLRV